MEGPKPPAKVLYVRLVLVLGIVLILIGIFLLTRDNGRPAVAVYTIVAGLIVAALSRLVAWIMQG